MTTNFDEWGAYLIGEVERLVGSAPDEPSQALLDEVRQYPTVVALLQRGARNITQAHRILLSCELSVGGTPLSLFTTMVTFGSPRDVTLDELTVELFYPADDLTADALRFMADS